MLLLARIEVYQKLYCGLITSHVIEENVRSRVRSRSEPEQLRQRQHIYVPGTVREPVMFLRVSCLSTIGLNWLLGHWS